MVKVDGQTYEYAVRVTIPSREIAMKEAPGV